MEIQSIVFKYDENKIFQLAMNSRGELNFWMHESYHTFSDNYDVGTSDQIIAATQDIMKKLIGKDTSKIEFVWTNQMQLDYGQIKEAIESLKTKYRKNKVEVVDI